MKNPQKIDNLFLKIRQWARTVMIVERGIAPKERLRQQDLYAERMQTGEKALVLKQTMTVILILKFKK